MLATSHKPTTANSRETSRSVKSDGMHVQEIKLLFHWKHGCRPYWCIVGRDDPRERKEFKRHPERVCFWEKGGRHSLFPQAQFDFLLWRGLVGKRGIYQRQFSTMLHLITWSQQTTAHCYAVQWKVQSTVQQCVAVQGSWRVILASVSRERVSENSVQTIQIINQHYEQNVNEQLCSVLYCNTTSYLRRW